MSEITTKNLADVLDVTPRTVSNLTQQEVLRRVGHGKYLLGPSIQSYVSYIRHQFEDEDGNQIDYEFEKALHEKVKREKTELQLAAMRGKMHREEDVAAVLNDMVAAFRAKMLGLPSKLAPQLVGAADLAIMTELLTQEVHEALSELSEYDPETFLALSEDYVGVDDGDSD